MILEALASVLQITRLARLSMILPKIRDSGQKRILYVSFIISLVLYLNLRVNSVIPQRYGHRNLGFEAAAMHAFEPYHIVRRGAKDQSFGEKYLASFKLTRVLTLDQVGRQLGNMDH